MFIRTVMWLSKFTIFQNLLVQMFMTIHTTQFQKKSNKYHLYKQIALSDSLPTRQQKHLVLEPTRLPRYNG